MKFSEKWLRSWVNPAISSDELGHTLTMAGLELESLEPVAPAFNDVVVAEVLQVEKHPNADRLNICQVNVGDEQPLTIVCGAKNVAPGIKVACARIGAVLPGNFKIKRAKVRQVESFGMLCAATELGMAEESDGLWLLAADAPVGASIRDYLDLDDQIFELSLTPNRSDCSGLYGVAREVAALTDTAFTLPKIDTVAAEADNDIGVQVQDAAGCPLYCGRSVRNVNAAAATPLWMVQRLERSGLRSINAIVDITNYVMLELGQPMHAFDLAQLSGDIQVRQARDDEGLTLLNEQQVALSDDVLVIADNQRILAIAGVMGGEHSGVETSSQNIFLESAFFAPDAIAGRARRFGLATDSSFRFERGVDYATTALALERATQLVLDICGGQAAEVIRVEGALPQRPQISLRQSRVERVLGISLDDAQIAALLTRLGFEFVQQGGEFKVSAPSFRFDLSIEADLVEELARLYGYDNIPAQAPRVDLTMLPVQETRQSDQLLKAMLVSRDYQEIISYAFVDEALETGLQANAQPVALQNPIASNLAVMRSSLLGGLLQALSFNLKRNQSRVRLFEMGACFQRAGQDYQQTERLSAIAYGSVLPEQWGAKSAAVDFYDVKADVAALFARTDLTFVSSQHAALHPGRSAEIFVDNQSVGWIGELHPKWLQAYDLPLPAQWFEIDLDVLKQRELPKMQAIARTLPMRRDLAFIVEENVAVQTLLDGMCQAAAPYVQGINLFDVYRGKGVEPGCKSLAFCVLLQDEQKTLTDTEIEPSVAMLIDVMQQHGAKLRV